jgi:hypothetical protein
VNLCLLALLDMSKHTPTKRNASSTSRQAAKRARPRSVNLTWIIGAAIAAVIVVAALIYANSSPVAPPTNSVLAQCGQPTCGQANAPVTVDEYSDFQ